MSTDSLILYIEKVKEELATIGKLKSKLEQNEKYSFK